MRQNDVKSCLEKIFTEYRNIFMAGVICIEPDLFQLVNIRLKNHHVLTLPVIFIHEADFSGQLMCFSNKLAYMMVVFM